MKTPRSHWRQASLACTLTALLLAACGGGDTTRTPVRDEQTSASGAPSSNQSEGGAGAAPNTQLTVQSMGQAETQALRVHAPQSLERLQQGSGTALMDVLATDATSRRNTSLGTPVHRMYNTVTGTYYDTANLTEVRSLLASAPPSFQLQGPVFWVDSPPSTGLSPVYRFFNLQSGVPLYTISETERASLLANSAQYRYEGVAYHASRVGDTRRVPLHRFHVPSKGFHYYTTSESEKAHIQSNQSATHIYQGIAFYVKDGHTHAHPVPLAPAPLYVSPQGSDNASGSYANPLRTIQRAASLAQPGQTVFIRAGTYRESITPARSGTASQPITYSAYPGEAVTIAGTEPVTGWAVDTGSIYKASMSWHLRPPTIPPQSSDSNPVLTDQVFLDGKMMVEARHPNVDVTSASLYSRAALSTVSGNLSASTAVTATASGLVSSANHYRDARFSVLPGSMWLAIPATVTASSDNQLELRFFNTEASTNYHPLPGNLFYLEGVKNLLDHPGEWFLDSANSTLYLMTPNRDSPASHTVEAKRRDIAFDLSGKSHITIKNLSVFAARIVTDSGSANNTLDGLDMAYVAHYALRRASAEGKSGITLAGSRNSLINSQIRHCSHTCISLSGSSHVVRNNVINDADYVATYDTAIGVRSGAADIVIEANSISDTGRSAIDMSSGCDSPRIRILNNTIFNTMLLTTDGGAIYTFDNNGGGAEIAYNLIYNTANKMHSAPNGGIYLDNNSTNFKVHHNVVAHTEYGINFGLPIPINPPNNNSCRQPRGETELMAHKAFHNTLSASYSGFVASAPGNPKPGKTALGTEVRNNIGHVTEISEALQNPNNDRGGVVSNNSNPSQDPSFIDSLALNFGLQSNSKVIDKGAPIAGESYLVAGTAPDQGAYEYSVPRWISGATRSSPAAPANVTVSGIGASTATVSWEAVAGVSHYTVERATRFKTDPYRQLVRVPAGTTSVSFNDMTANTPYFYRVRAVDRVGNYSPMNAPVAMRTSGTTSALGVFQGESHDAMVDGAIVNNHAAIGYLRTTSYLIYKNIDFSSHPTTLNTSLGSHSSGSGNTIEFRAGSPTGALIAMIAVPTSGGITSRSVPADTAALAATDVYVLFKGPTANWNFGAFDSFGFSP